MRANCMESVWMCTNIAQMTKEEKSGGSRFRWWRVVRTKNWGIFKTTEKPSLIINLLGDQLVKYQNSIR